jgi:C-terminal processing protease CtpA/Prc
MKVFNNSFKELIILMLALIFVFSCKKSEDDEDNGITPSPEVPTLASDTLKVNRFILDCAEIYYLWVDDIDIDKFEDTYDSYTDPQKLFDDIKHKDDKWSTLTNSFNEMEESFEGVSKSFGWVPIRVTWSNAPSVRYFYIVLFVYPGTPADLAGIKRGDYIVEINGSRINSSNYMDVYNATNITVTKGYIEVADDVASLVPDNSTTTSLTASAMYEDPILKDTVLVMGDKRIGYLCYTDFYQESEQGLIEVFRRFKNENVTDVIVDLRYNGGGYVRTSVVLTSLMAPPEVIQGGKAVFQHQIWNQVLTDYLLEEGYDMTEYFTDTLLDANPAPQSIYFLTSEFTASASEAAIVALQPYMPGRVKTVGETTAGKFVGGGLLSPPDVYQDAYANYFNSIKNWGMYLMWFRYTNKDETNFMSGIEPNYPVITDTYNNTAEDYFDLQPFGSITDPLLSEAIYRITGIQITYPRKTSISINNFKPVFDISEGRSMDGKLIVSPKKIPPLQKKY